MSIAVQQAKAFPILDLSFTANEDLSSSQGCIVSLTSESSGRAKVGLPSGQGVKCVGVLLNAPASGESALVRVLGLAEVKWAGSASTGVLVTPNGSTGVGGAGSSGDYCLGHLIEASAEANHMVSCLLTGTFVIP